MEKSGIYVKLFIGTFFIGFFCLIVYVSLLGDNHKINFAVEHFFTQIKNNNYSAICDPEANIDPLKAETCKDHNFLLETAFLIKYNLISAENYSIKIQRSHFRLPYINDDKVTISVALIPVQENFVKAFFGNDDIDYVNDFMVAEKINNVWKVTDIKLNDPSLATIYTKLKAEMNVKHYVTRTEHGYRINKTNLDPTNLTPLQRRLFVYSMNKLSSM